MYESFAGACTFDGTDRVVITPAVSLAAGNTGVADGLNVVYVVGSRLGRGVGCFVGSGDGVVGVEYKPGGSGEYVGRGETVLTEIAGVGVGNFVGASVGSAEGEADCFRVNQPSTKTPFMTCDNHTFPKLASLPSIFVAQSVVTGAVVGETVTPIFWSSIRR